MISRFGLLGFTTAWEQRKLGEVLTEIKRPIKMDDSKEYELVTVKRRNEGIVSRGLFKGKDILVKNYYELKAGDYVISKRQVVHGANGQVPLDLDGAIVSNEYLVSIGNKNITTSFLTILSRLPSMYKMFFLSSYGIDIEKLVFDVDDWKRREVLIPPLLEQNQISDFFRTLDELIAKQKRKCDGLKDLKKAYLQQMFPSDGEDVPRVRFDGFHGKWEKRRLGDVADFSKGSGYSKGDLSDKGTPVILYGRLYTNYQTAIDEVDTFVTPQPNSIFSLGGEVIVPSSGETAEDIARASVVTKAGIILGGDLNIIKANTLIEPYFLALTISNGNQQKDLRSRAQGKSVVHIRNSDLKDVTLNYPSVMEQSAIGEFFRMLDGQISAQQHKLTQLKRLKTAYLQKMFV